MNLLKKIWLVIPLLLWLSTDVLHARSADLVIALNHQTLPNNDTLNLPDWSQGISDTLRHIDFEVLKAEVLNSHVPISLAAIWDTSSPGISRVFYHKDYGSHSLDFVYDEDLDHLWYYYDGQVLINLAQCERLYNIAVERNKQFDIWIEDRWIAMFVEAIIAQELFAANVVIPKENADKVVLWWLLPLTIQYKEALSETPSYETIWAMYFYAVRMAEVIQDITYREFEWDDYEPFYRSEYELMFQLYRDAFTHYCHEHYPQDFANAKKIILGKLRDSREMDAQWARIRKKYRYIWPEEQRGNFFDKHWNMRDELFMGKSIDPQYVNLFVRQWTYFDEDGSFAIDRYVGDCFSFFSFLKEEDFDGIVGEYQELLENHKD